MLVDVGEEVVVDRWARLPVQATFLGVDRPQSLLRAEPPDPVVGRLMAGLAQVVGDEPVAQRRVVAVQVDRAFVR